MHSVQCDTHTEPTFKQSGILRIPVPILSRESITKDLSNMHLRVRGSQGKCHSSYSDIKCNGVCGKRAI